MWYAQRNPAAAVRFEHELEEMLTAIRANPEGFPLIDDQHREAILARFPFSVIFRTLADAVAVVAVAHGSRAPGYWRTRV